MVKFLLSVILVCIIPALTFSFKHEYEHYKPRSWYDNAGTYWIVIASATVLLGLCVVWSV